MMQMKTQELHPIRPKERNQEHLQAVNVEEDAQGVKWWSGAVRDRDEESDVDRNPFKVDAMEVVENEEQADIKIKAVANPKLPTKSGDRGA